MILKTRMKASLAATAAAALAGGLLAVAPAHADTTTLPVAESATLVAPSVGGLTPFLPISCGVQVVFNDDTPSAPEAYLARFTQGDQVLAYQGVSVPDATAPTKFEVTVPCDELVDGATYEVNVTEEGQAAGSSIPFAYSVVEHPSRISATSQNVNGVEGFTPGRAVTVSYPAGTWEPGTKFSTRVWVSKTPEFTSADYVANTRGGTALVNRLNSDTQVLTFTPPTWTEGMYAWYSVVGTKEGEAPYRFTFSAVPIHNLPAMPTGWVKSFGAKKTWAAKVGKESRVSAVVYSATGKKQGLKAQYQWFLDKKTTAISGATGKAFKPWKKHKGNDLKLRVRVVDDKKAPRIKWFSFGTIK